MSGKLYIGVSNTSKKGKKIYVGVSNVAKLAKKAYVGVNGVARPFFSSSKEVAYYGNTFNLTNRSLGHTATNVGDYVVFTGGYIGGYNNNTANLEAYNSQLTKFSGTISKLTEAKSYLESAYTGNKENAVFAGGYNTNGYTTSSLDVYNANLTKVTTSLTIISIADMTPLSAKGYALFASGKSGSASSSITSYNNTVYVVNNNLTSSYVRLVANAGMFRSMPGRVGDYALFAGGVAAGSDKPRTTNVEALNLNSMTTTLTNALPNAAANGAGASMNNFAVFAGGDSAEAHQNSVAYANAYNASLTRVSIAALSEARRSVKGVSAPEIVVVAGGYTNNYTRSNVAESYDANLTKLLLTPLSVARDNHVGVGVGDYALFAGGNIQSNVHDDSTYTVEVYKIL